LGLAAGGKSCSTKRFCYFCIDQTFWLGKFYATSTQNYKAESFSDHLKSDAVLPMLKA